MSPNVLSDFRLDIGDEAIPSGIVGPPINPINSLRVDTGDDNNTASSLGTIPPTGNCTDNAVVRYNGTDCSTIQESPVTIDDSGTIDTPGSLNVAGSINVTGIINGLYKFREELVSSSIVLTNSDNILFVNKTIGSPTSVQLPIGVPNGHKIIIKDAKGDSGINNITVTPPTGLIDGQPFFILGTSFTSLSFIKCSSGWGII
jgi:hypothetical protein